MDTSIFRFALGQRVTPAPHSPSVSGLSMSACCWTTRSRVRPCSTASMEGRPDVRHEWA